MENRPVIENPGRFVLGCQFGNHGEPFLWRGSGNDDIDLAVMELIRLSELDMDSALEVAEEIGSLLSKAKEENEEGFDSLLPYVNEGEELVNE